MMASVTWEVLHPEARVQVLPVSTTIWKQHWEPHLLVTDITTDQWHERLIWGLLETGDQRLRKHGQCR